MKPYGACPCPRAGFLFVLSLVTSSLVAGTAIAATLPAGFEELAVAEGLARATAFQIAPDGRIFVTLQGGTVRVIKDGTLLPEPFVTLTVESSGERGLFGITFDPSFAINQYVYLHYTATTPALHNRVSRFTAAGDVAAPGSEVPIVDLDPLGANLHNGGAIDFGPDGKLYVAVGDNTLAHEAQSLATRFGKILRYNPDGSIPADNPFDAQATGENRAIWAMGLRNPYTFAFNRGPVGPSMLINDVGDSTYEEIDDGLPGANYGWPYTEGDFAQEAFPAFTRPRHAYGRDGGCAITGGAFYAPAVATFPADYLHDYLFADFCAGTIRRLDPARNTVTPFATGLGFPVDLKVAADGSLYYLQRGGGGRLLRVVATTAPPAVPAPPTDLTAYTNGLTLRVSWAESSGAENYILEAGSTSGASDIYTGNLGSATAIEGVVPAGTYSIRVLAANAIGISEDSMELQVSVSGTAACVNAPPRPSWFNAQAGGLLTRLAWDASPSSTSYILEAGSAAGLADLLRADLGNTTALTGTAGEGTYFVRTRARNACGESAPSPELPVTLGCTHPPPPPSGITHDIAGGVLTVQWAGAFGHTGYMFDVGSRPGVTDVLSFELGPATTFQAPLDNVPPATYYARVRAITTCGITGASNEIAVAVP